ncbi:hypothetical protein HID58_081494, partial [Brassica napus]
HHGVFEGFGLSGGRDSSGFAVLCFVFALRRASLILCLLMGVILLCLLSFRRKLTVVSCPLRCSAARFVCALLARRDRSSAINSSASVCQYFTDASATGLFVSSPFLSELRLEWTVTDVMAGPRLGQPCFACPPVAVAFGTVCGPSDCSPVANSTDLLSCYRFRYQGQEVIY